MGKDYLLTNVDRGLWREFKAACAHYDISIRASLIEYIQTTVNDYRIYQREYSGIKKNLKKKGKK